MGNGHVKGTSQYFILALHPGPGHNNYHCQIQANLLQLLTQKETSYFCTESSGRQTGTTYTKQLTPKTLASN
jgi:hypothetical protein